MTSFAILSLLATTPAYFGVFYPDADQLELWKHSGGTSSVIWRRQLDIDTVPKYMVLPSHRRQVFLLHKSGKKTAFEKHSLRASEYEGIELDNHAVVLMPSRLRDSIVAIDNAFQATRIQIDPIDTFSLRGERPAIATGSHLLAGPAPFLGATRAGVTTVFHVRSSGSRVAYKELARRRASVDFLSVENRIQFLTSKSRWDQGKYLGKNVSIALRNGTLFAQPFGPKQRERAIGSPAIRYSGLSSDPEARVGFATGNDRSSGPQVTVVTEHLRVTSSPLTPGYGTGQLVPTRWFR